MGVSVFFVFFLQLDTPFTPPQTVSWVFPQWPPLAVIGYCTIMVLKVSVVLKVALIGELHLWKHDAFAGVKWALQKRVVYTEVFVVLPLYLSDDDLSVVTWQNCWPTFCLHACLPARDHKTAIHINLLPTWAVYHFNLHIYNEVTGGMVSGTLLCILKWVFPLMEAGRLIHLSVSQTGLQKATSEQLY